MCGVYQHVWLTQRLYVYVSDDKNCTVWCLGRLCRRTWADVLAREPSVHVTFLYWLSTFSRNLIKNNFSRIPGQRLYWSSLSDLFSAEQISKDLGQRIQVWALTLLLNRSIVKKQAVKQSVNSHYLQRWLSHDVHWDLKRYYEEVWSTLSQYLHTMKTNLWKL